MRGNKTTKWSALRLLAMVCVCALVFVQLGTQTAEARPSLKAKTAETTAMEALARPQLSLFDAVNQVVDVDDVQGDMFVSPYTSLNGPDDMNCFPGVAGGFFCDIDGEAVTFDFTIVCSHSGDVVLDVDFTLIEMNYRDNPSATWAVPAGSGCSTTVHPSAGWEAVHSTMGCLEGAFDAGRSCRNTFVINWVGIPEATVSLDAVLNGPDNMECFPGVAGGSACFIDGQAVTIDYKLLCGYPGGAIEFTSDVTLTSFDWYPNNDATTWTVPEGVVCVAWPTDSDGDWVAADTPLYCQPLAPGESCDLEFVMNWNGPVAPADATFTVNAVLNGPDSMSCSPGFVGGFTCFLDGEMITLPVNVVCIVPGEGTVLEAELTISEFAYPNNPSTTWTVPEGSLCAAEMPATAEWAAVEVFETCAPLAAGGTCALDFEIDWIEPVAPAEATFTVDAVVYGPDSMECVPGFAGGWGCFIDGQQVAFPLNVLCTVPDVGTVLEAELQIATFGFPELNTSWTVPEGSVCAAELTDSPNWEAQDPFVLCDVLAADEICEVEFVVEWVGPGGLGSADLQLIVELDGPDSMECVQSNPPVFGPYDCYIDGELVSFNYDVSCVLADGEVVFETTGTISIMSYPTDPAWAVPHGSYCGATLELTPGWVAEYNPKVCPVLTSGATCWLEFNLTWIG